MFGFIRETDQDTGICTKMRSSQVDIATLDRIDELHAHLSAPTLRTIDEILLEYYICHEKNRSPQDFRNRIKKESFIAEYSLEAFEYLSVGLDDVEVVFS